MYSMLYPLLLTAPLAMIGLAPTLAALTAPVDAVVTPLRSSALAVVSARKGSPRGTGIKSPMATSTAAPPDRKLKVFP